MNRKLIAITFGIVVLVVCGITLAQSPIPMPGPYVPPQINPLTPPANTPSSNVPSGKATQPEDLTIDQILDAVDNIRDQKADLEKKEKFYLRALHRKTEKLKERIDRMDPETSPPATCPIPVPPVLVQPVPQTQIPGTVPTSTTSGVPILSNLP